MTSQPPPAPQGPHPSSNPQGPGEPGTGPSALRRRWPLWTALGCGALALLLLVGIGGVVAVLTLRGDGESAPAPMSSAAPEETEDASPTEEQNTDEEAPTDEAPEASDGGGEDAAAGAPGTTAENPAPAGTAVTVPTEGGGSFEVTLGTPEWDAEQRVLEANSMNDPAPDGQVYVLIPATATYQGEGPEDYWITVSTLYVDSTGAEHRQAQGVVPPRIAIELPEFTDGSTGEFDLVFLLPESEQGKGSVAIGSAEIFADDFAYVLPE